ncbi:hypothetical protein C8R44DRAFT_877186 [Mycena epipterygia]|nr:hypothetical protein C8R44DRAFT_877186 [Mycena epipterygia]
MSRASTRELKKLLHEMNRPILELGATPSDLYLTPFDRALVRLATRDAPIKIESPEHAKMLWGLILSLRFVAFWKFAYDIL